MKIALISSSFPPYSKGGISSAHYGIYNIYRNKNYNIRAYTFYDHGIKSEGININRNGMPKILYVFVYLISSFIKLLIMILTCARHAYQLQDIIMSLYGSLCINKQLKKDAPDIIILPDHGAPGLLIKKRKSKIIYFSHHNPMRFVNIPQLGKYSYLDAKIAVFIENIVLKKVDKVVCPSKYMLKEFKKTYNYKREIVVISNIINSDLIKNNDILNISDELNIHNNIPFIYIPSAGSKIKGKDYVNDIIKMIAERYEKKIGYYLSGNISKSFKKKLLNDKPKNVVLFMPGNLDYIKNISYIKNCILCISPTLLEGFGMAIYEALILEVPVVAFNTGAVSDIIYNGENGFVVEYLNINKIVEKSLKIILNKKNSSNKKLHYKENEIIKQYIGILK